MRTQITLPVLTLTAAVLTGGALLAPALAQPGPARPDAPAAAAANALPLSQVLARLEAAGYTAIDEIERERDAVEVKATDAQGRRVELKLDPTTAQVLRTEFKGEKQRLRTAQTQAPTAAPVPQR